LISAILVGRGVLVMTGLVISGLTGGVIQRGGLARTGEGLSKKIKRNRKIIFFILFENSQF